MDNERLLQQLRESFMQELEQHVEALDRDLLALERENSPEARTELLHSIFRTAHTIKGSSRAAGVTIVEDASHIVETTLSQLRAGKVPLGPGVVQRLFEVGDALREVAARLRRGEPLEGTALSDAARALSEETERPSSPMSVASISAPGVPRTSATSLAPRSRRADEAANERIDAIIARSAELRVALRALDEQESTMRTVADELARSMASTSVSALPAGSPLREALRRATLALDGVADRHRREVRTLSTSARRLDESVRTLRLVPLTEAVQGLPRAMRDLAMATGKEVQLLLEGEGLEVDRDLAEGLRDPLLQLLRNAVDHGLELPEVRTRAGKPALGTVRISFSIGGDELEITMSDDGRGLDREAIRARARERGLPEAHDDEDVLRTIFQPGFSTANLVTSVSGRGVGLDILRKRVEDLHGTIALRSIPGAGTHIELVLPLTMTALRVVLVESAGVVHAIPGTAVRRFIRVDASDVHTVSGVQTIHREGRSIPIVSLERLLGAEEIAPRPRASVVVLSGQDGLAAVIVDAILAETEVTAKPLGARLAGLPIASSATLLPDGRPALILSAAELVRRAYERGESRPLLAQKVEGDRRKRVLLADDSLTTRTLEKSILEGAGYAVLATVDGAEAFRVLQEQGADVVVSDVEMPNMDGIALTEAIRASARFKDLPVVLVTARGNEEDRARGLTAGADAYLVKSAFDQEQLLETLSRLL